MPATVSWISRRASAMSCRRRLRSFSRHRRSSRRIPAGVPAGSSFQAGSRVRIAEIVSDTVSPAKRRSAGQHFPQHAAERPDVGSLVDNAATSLLGRHVTGCAEDDAVSGWPYGRCRRAGLSSVVAFRGLREAKIENFDGPVGPELHIGWFEIAMHDTAQVSFFERGRNLVCNRARFVERESGPVRFGRQAWGLPRVPAPAPGHFDSSRP